MGNRSRHKSRHVSKPAKLDVPLAQMMRTQCTQCAGPVQWLTPEQTRAHGVDLGPALQFLGSDGVTEVWVCTRCDNYGVMGPTIGGFL